VFKLQTLAVSPRVRRLLPMRVLVAVAIGGLLGGCASRAPTAQQAQVRQQPVKVASYDYDRRIRVEDDGIEEQAAPRKSTKVEVDDPREPFSPNYGRYIR